MTKKANILFLDDEESIVNSLKRLFKLQYNVFCATTGDMALKIAEENNIHVIVSDQRMPGTTGVEFFDKVKTVSPNSVRILLTGYADLEAVVRAVNEGEVFRYLNKPWDNEQIKNTVDMAADIALQTMDSVAGVTTSSDVAKSGVPGDVEYKAHEAPVDLLVIDNDDDTVTVLNELFPGRVNIFHATDIESALEILGREKYIGVIVSELNINGDDLTKLMSSLKTLFPQIVTIVMTSFSDLNTIVGLINKSQVFRFLPKPSSKNLLAASIGHAIDKYKVLQSSPTLAKRHSVDSDAWEEKDGEKVLKPAANESNFGVRLKKVLHHRLF